MAWISVIGPTGIAAMAALLDTTTANAFYGGAVDLSAYQTGNYAIRFINTVGGGTAIAYISATAPGGETLSGIELMINGTMELSANWVVTGGPSINERSNEQAHSGTYSWKQKDGAHFYYYGGNPYVSGCLYKTSGWVYPGADGNATQYLLLASGVLLSSSATAVVNGAWRAMPTVYGTETVTGVSADNVYALLSSRATACYWDDMSVQRVTMPVITGALLLSSKNGSRGWYQMDAAFNPNAAMTYEILLDEIIAFYRGTAPAGSFLPSRNPDYSGYQQGRQWYQPKNISDGGDPYIYSKGEKGKRYIKWSYLPDADLTDLLAFVASMSGGRYKFLFTDVDGTLYTASRIRNADSLTYRSTVSGYNEVTLEIEVA